ncbi:hypothetical protein AAFC00_002342 [Neodothiora populina]|uniref:Palmitoyl-protein thioesterase 1 n=1 Tax=Neodothiora populina TaxID=2781224 RepID=A0ABR3PH45_9PEZI
MKRSILAAVAATPSLASVIHTTSRNNYPASSSALTSVSASSTPLPLLIWHGLGDRYDADGIQEVAALANRTNPGTYVYPIRLAEDGSSDSRATFFGNMSEYIEQVCNDLSENPKLLFSQDGTKEPKKTIKANALGFSQGGQFLRALHQRCPILHLSTLMTFGSQHSGINQFQACAPLDFLCKGALSAAKSNAFSAWAQSHVVPAQYYRTINETTGEASDEFLEGSRFLADVNNERALKSQVYKDKIAGLDRFVMYVFENDTTVLPKESGWFAEVNVTDNKVTPLRQRKLYTEDWLGLKTLDEKKKDALVFRTVPGGHMNIDEDMLESAFKEFFGAKKEDEDEDEDEDEKWKEQVHDQEASERVHLTTQEQQILR